MRCFNLMRRNHYCRCWCQATRGPAELTNLLIDMGQMNNEIGKIIKFLFSLTGIFKDFSLNGGVLYHSVHIIIFQMEYWFFSLTVDSHGCTEGPLLTRKSSFCVRVQTTCKAFAANEWCEVDWHKDLFRAFFSLKCLFASSWATLCM